MNFFENAMNLNIKVKWLLKCYEMY